MKTKLLEYGLLHVRACGPVTQESIRQFLLEQLPGCDENNVDALTCAFIERATEEGLIGIYEVFPRTFGRLADENPIAYDYIGP